MGQSILHNFIISYNGGMNQESEFLPYLHSEFKKKYNLVRARAVKVGYLDNC